MLAFLPLLTSVIPGLIKIAEHKFEASPPPVAPGEIALPSNGSAKKAFVMSCLSALYDMIGARFVHDFPNLDEKKLFLDLSSVLIDHLVPQVLA